MLTAIILNLEKTTTLYENYFETINNGPQCFMLTLVCVYIYTYINVDQ